MKITTNVDSIFCSSSQDTTVVSFENTEISVPKDQELIIEDIRYPEEYRYISSAGADPDNRVEEIELWVERVIKSKKQNGPPVVALGNNPSQPLNVVLPDGEIIKLVWVRDCLRVLIGRKTTAYINSKEDFKLEHYV